MLQIAFGSGLYSCLIGCSMGTVTAPQSHCHEEVPFSTFHLHLWWNEIPLTPWALRCGYLCHSEEKTYWVPDHPLRGHFTNQLGFIPLSSQILLMKSYICTLHVYMYVTMCTWMWMAMETIRGQWIPWGWSYRQLWTAVWHGCWELNRSPRKTARSLNGWAFSPASYLKTRTHSHIVK